MNTNLPTTTGTKTSTKREARRTTKFLQTTLLSALFFLLLGVGESWGQCGPFQVYESFGTAATSTQAGTWSNTSISFNSTSGVPRTGTYCAVFNALADVIRTPQISNPGVFSFWYKRSSTTTGTPSFIVETSPDNSTWTQRGTSITSFTTTYQQFTIDLGALGLTGVYVRIRDARASGTVDRYVDDLSWTSTVAASNTILIQGQSCTPTLTAGVTYSVYDTGGVNETYNNSQTSAPMVLTPPSGYGLTINITSIGTESSTDYLKLYNGNSIAASAMHSGSGFSGTTAPGSFSSTNATYSLTIDFTSDISVTGIGFVGTLTLPTLPSCASQPTALTSPAIAATTATISWTAASTAPASGYEIYYSTASTAPVSGTAATTTTGAGVVTKNITGLTANTAYYYWVRSNCNGTDKSNWVSGGSFTTACAAGTLPYTQNFESVSVGSIPTCTQVVQAGSGNLWNTVSAPGNGFTNMTLKYTYNSTYAANTWYFINGLSLTAGQTYVLTYRYGTINTSTFFENLKVAYGTSATAAAMTTTLVTHASVANGTATSNTVTITPLTTGTYYIGFQCYSVADQNALYIDDISVTQPIISTSGTLSAFSSCSGSASTAQSFTVSGTDLTANLVVTAPTGFQVATTNSDASFASSVTLTQISGSVASTTIYARMASLSSSPTAGNITCVSSPATTQNVAVSGTVNSTPVAVTVTGGAICSGGTITVSGGTGGTIYWQGTTSGGTSTTSSGTTSPAITAAATYYARAKSSAGCWGTEGSASVTITAVPSCIATGFSPANANSSVNPTAGTTITWSAVSGATSYDIYFGTDNPPTNLVNGTNQSGETYSTGALSESTTYYWKVVPKNLCGAASSCSVYSFTAATACTAPSISSTSKTNINCFGQSTGTITVNASGGTSPYQYSKDNGTTWLSSNVFGSLASGSYNIVVKGGDACIGAPSVVNLTQPLAALAVSASGGGSGCANATKTLSSTVTGGTSPYTYSWSNPSGLSSGTVANPTATIGSFSSHTLTVTDANGCSATSSAVSITNNSPAAPTASNPAAICAGTPVNIVATSAGNTINWYNDATGGTAITTLVASGANYSVSPSATKTYYAETQATSAGTPQTVSYTSTGANQTWTVPAGVTSINVKMWGAGGAGSYYNPPYISSGGSGGYVSGTLAVTPGQVLNLVVGSGGKVYSNNTVSQYGGGGPAGSGTGYSGGGGGRSAIQFTSGTDYVTVGGGGGAGPTPYNSVPTAIIGIGYGGAGGGNTGGSSSANYYIGVTTGGTQSAGGTNTGSDYNGGSGSQYLGGTGASQYIGAGGGGGGYYGGGGGGVGWWNFGSNSNGGGGGGGSSYVANLTSATNTQGNINSAGAQAAAPSNTDLNYVSGVGIGGAGGTSNNGGNGLIVITYTAPVAGCVSATRTPVTVTVNAVPTANSGAAMSAICSGATSAAMGGTIGGTATSGTWSGGTGTWANASDYANATYTAGALESGTITLTLTPSGTGSCTAVPATKTIVVNALPIANAGTDTTICSGSSTRLVSSSPDLSSVLSAINSNQASLISSIPTPYGFVMDATGGVNGNYISDGTGDMYDSGNYINTNLGSTISYSDNNIVSNSAFGSGGKYFTRVIGNQASSTTVPTIFYWAADLNGLSSVSITGGNGADGTGSQDLNSFSINANGIDYTCFLKRVYNAGDPSINHLFIVPNPNSATQSMGTTTDDDLHTISGLSGVNRMYYMLYAGSSGTAISVAAATSIAQTFVNIIPVATYSWSSSPVGFTSTSANPSVSPTSTTTYSLTLTNNGCTSLSDDVIVTVNQPSVAPTSLSASTATICNGNNTTLTQTGGSLGTGAVWQWYTNNTFTTTVGGTLSSSNASLSVSPTTTTTYYLRAISGTSPCAASVPATTPSTVSVTVTVNQPSVAPTSLSASTATICNGNNTTLTQTGGSLGTGAVWQWYSDASFSTTVGGTLSASNASLSVSPTTTTTYYLRAINGTSPCAASVPATTPSTVSVTVTVNQPSVAPTAITGTITICNGSSTTLTANGTLGTGANYQWGTGSVVGTNPIAGETSATLTVSPTSTTTYWVRITNSTAPCTATTSGVTTLVTVNQPSVAPTSISGTTTICNNQSTTLTANGGTVGTGANYQWGTGSTVGSSIISGETASTLSVSPTSTTTYWVRITNGTSPCSASTDGVTATVTVNPLPTATITAGSATTFCSGGSVELTASSGSSYVWKKDGNTIPGAAVQTYSTTTAGDYTVTVTNATGCSATSVATTVSLYTLPSMPTAISYNCTGDAVLTATAGTGETVAWYTSNSQSAALASNQTYLSNTATLTIASPSAGSYYAFATNANGCMSANGTETPVEITAKNNYTGGVSGTNTDWFTAGNWSCGTVPTATTNVVIPTGKIVSISYASGHAPAEAGTVTLEGTAALTVTTDHDITVTGKVTVASGANFTVQNRASLLQTDNVTNEGSIVVNKSTPSDRLLKIYDAVMWSSPVSQKLKAMSTGTLDAYFMQHAPLTNSWASISSPSTTDFTQGKGYLVRTPMDFSFTQGQQWNVSFTGVPNNGAITYDAGNMDSVERFLLVGNPYPSAISIAAFKAANPNITGVFYFFRKPNEATDISGYGTLNSAGDFTSNDGTRGALQPGSVIPSGQGFFVRMKNNSNDGKIYFTNTMRVANDHGHFNRANANQDMYRLLVQTPTTGNNQLLVKYDPTTTVDYDLGVDAVAFTDGSTDLSSIMNTKNYRIQARGDYNAADVIPLRFKTGVAGEHRIKLQDVQGVFAADQMVCIKDNVTGTVHNLTANGDYVFTATAGTFTTRFEVVYQQAYYTALQSVSCGSTLSNMSSLVYANVVEGASGYRFKVVNNTTSAVQTIDRQYHWFALNMLPSYDYNTSYSISVQVQKDGVWVGYYGTPCSVNSPNIASTGIMQINPSQCGVTLPTLGYVIATTPVAGATGYKFRITNTTAGASGANLVQEITRTNHWFTLAMLARYNYGSSYAIEVAVKTTGGYTPYGNACTVYSPAVPTLVSCGQAVATATTLVRTTAMTMATQYRFQVTRMATQETITFDTANYWFSFRVNVPGYAAGEQYGVRIAVMTAGAWSPYGDACEITAPIATARTSEQTAPSDASLFKPVAYPNPFKSEFSIALATPYEEEVTLVVYDLQGRLIEKQTVPVTLIDTIHIGANYQMGDYMLVVSQGPAIESMLLHKE